MAEFTLPEVQPLVDYYYSKPGNGSGGSLHIVLDDFNTEDSCVEWCHDYAEGEGDHEGAFLAALLLRMSRTQRYKLGRNARVLH